MLHQLYPNNICFFDTPTVNNTSNDLLTYYKLRILQGGYNKVNKIENQSAINITGNGKNITKIQFQYTVYKNYVMAFQTNVLTYNYSNQQSVDFAEDITNILWSFGNIYGNSTWLSVLQLKVTNSDGTTITKNIEVTQEIGLPASNI